MLLEDLSDELLRRVFGAESKATLRALVTDSQRRAERATASSSPRAHAGERFTIDQATHAPGRRLAAPRARARSDDGAVHVSIAEDLRKADRELKKLLADVGGANTPEMKGAARVLAKSIRKQLGKKGTRRDRSKPGEAPRRQTGKA
jgi:hypothetical protein